MNTYEVMQEEYILYKDNLAKDNEKKMKEEARNDQEKEKKDTT